MCHELTRAPASADDLLVAKEVAQRLNVHVSTVYRLVESGALRAHRIGEGTRRRRGLRIPAGAVTEYLDGSQTTKEMATCAERLRRGPVTDQAA